MRVVSRMGHPLAGSIVRTDGLRNCSRESAPLCDISATAAKRNGKAKSNTAPCLTMRLHPSSRWCRRRVVGQEVNRAKLRKDPSNNSNAGRAYKPGRRGRLWASPPPFPGRLRRFSLPASSIHKCAFNLGRAGSARFRARLRDVGGCASNPPQPAGASVHNGEYATPKLDTSGSDCEVLRN